MQPLPLLAANKEQAAQAAYLEIVPQGLFEQFWPGPLTVLLPALPALPAPLVNNEGKAAVRVSPYRQAAELARLAGGVLTASSANQHGRPPACRLLDIDPQLLLALEQDEQDEQNERGEQNGGEAGVFEGDIAPAGGLPSTLVEPLLSTEQGKPCLRLVRAGAVSVEVIESAGFRVRFA